MGCGDGKQQGSLPAVRCCGVRAQLPPKEPLRGQRHSPNPSSHPASPAQPRRRKDAHGKGLSLSPHRRCPQQLLSPHSHFSPRRAASTSPHGWSGKSFGSTWSLSGKGSNMWKHGRCPMVGQPQRCSSALPQRKEMGGGFSRDGGDTTATAVKRKGNISGRKPGA